MKTYIYTAAMSMLVICSSFANASSNVVASIGDNLFSSGQNIAVAAANVAGAVIYVGSYGANGATHALKKVTENPVLLAGAGVGIGYGLYYRYQMAKYDHLLQAAQDIVDLTDVNTSVRSPRTDLVMVNWALFPTQGVVFEHAHAVDQRPDAVARILARDCGKLQICKCHGKSTTAKVQNACLYAKNQILLVMRRLEPLTSTSESAGSNSYLRSAFTMVQRVAFPYQVSASGLYNQLRLINVRLDAISLAAADAAIEEQMYPNVNNSPGIVCDYCRLRPIV